MGMRIRDAARTGMANFLVDQVDVGTADIAKLQLYAGTPPATFGDAPSGDLLAEFDLADPAFDAAVTGVAAYSDLPLATVGLDAGDVGYYRVIDIDGDVVWDNDLVSTDGSTGLVLNTLTISVDVAVTVTAWTVTQPAGALEA